MSDELPHVWDGQSQKLVGVEDCNRCLFRLRAQPWAHILCQDDFGAVFSQKLFGSGLSGGMLNRHALSTQAAPSRSRLPHRPVAPRPGGQHPPFLREEDLRTVNVYARCFKNRDVSVVR